MMSGILVGKKAKYNQLILESLFYGEKTTQQIAEYIFNEEHKQNKGDRRKIKHIRSVIERKGTKPNRMGRLEELEKKGYIVRNKDKKWELTFKGLALVSTWHPREDLENSYLLERLSEEKNLEKFKNVFDLITKMFNFKAIGKSRREAKTIIKHAWEEFFGPNMIFKIQDFANKLKLQGFDFDKIDNDDFERMFALDLSKQMAKKLLEKKYENSQARVCPRCNAKITDEKFKFCPYCASKLPE